MAKHRRTEIRTTIHVIMLAAFFCGLAKPAFATTCTERQQVCYAYCEKTYNNAPKCKEACKNYLAQCMSTGCWESNVTARRCGFDKR